VFHTDALQAFFGARGGQQVVALALKGGGQDLTGTWVVVDK
jgi:hypothetical protein